MPKSVRLQEQKKRVKDLHDDPAGYVERQFKSYAAGRYYNEGEWLLNTAFYLGHHYHQWLSGIGKLREIAPSHRNRQRIVINRTQPIIHTTVSKLCKNPPLYRIVPSTNENEDVKAARGGEKILVSEYNRMGVQMLDQELMLELVTCGNTFRKILWNPESGQELAYTDPLTDRTEMVHEGNVEFENISCFDLFAPPRASSLKDCDDILH